MRFPLLCRPQETIAHAPLDVELVYISSVLDLAARDEDVGFVPQSVLVHRHTGRAAVVEENLSVAPCLVLVSDDMVLQVSNSFSLPESGSLAIAILKLKR